MSPRFVLLLLCCLAGCFTQGIRTKVKRDSGPRDLYDSLSEKQRNGRENNPIGSTSSLDYPATRPGQDISNKRQFQSTPAEKPALSTNNQRGTNTPLGATNTPLGATNKPLGATNTPLGATNKPLGATNKPLGATNKPLGATNTLLGATNKPLAATNTPLGATNTPLGASNTILKENQSRRTGTGDGSVTEPVDAQVAGTGSETKNATVCYPVVGCFDLGKPWRTSLRPVGAPQSPEKIQTTIFYYSRDNPELAKNITLYPEINMGEVQFDPSKITVFIIHGFSNSGNATWMKDMKDVYLNKVDANVMLVDWGKGAQQLNYFQVAGNTRVVGKELGLFVTYLKQKYGADPGKFHLIGHSLGAQISSYIGKEVQGIARLTALDPAQPAFEGFDKEVRLDKTDAEFVDVIHTDARPFIPTLGFGMITPHGHVDFYMNGGFDQPGCVAPSKKEIPSIMNALDLAKFPVEVIAKMVACPHARSYEYLTEAFNETENCIFWGHKVDTKSIFKSVSNTLTQGLFKKFTALSTTCSKDDCIPLGFATKKSPLRGAFVVTTNARAPYCISEKGVSPEEPSMGQRAEEFIQEMGKKLGIN